MYMGEQLRSTWQFPSHLIGTCGAIKA